MATRLPLKSPSTPKPGSDLKAEISAGWMFCEMASLQMEAAMGWTNDQLFEALKRYEADCEAAGMRPISVQSYVDYSRRFLRWRDF